MASNDLIAYYRLSKEKRRNGHQDQSAWGWSLEGQQADVEALARARCAEILASYREIETGERSDRPELAKAIAHASATLVIAKLDRLARNVHFVSGLMDRAHFVACDNPHANRLTIHILAAVAEDEARRISQRTKDALAAAKRPTTWASSSKRYSAGVASSGKGQVTPWPIRVTAGGAFLLAAVVRPLVNRSRPVYPLYSSRPSDPIFTPRNRKSPEKSGFSRGG